MFTIANVAEEFGVGVHTVLQWIRAGELQATNVSRTPSGRPQWRISETALEAFKSLRTTIPTQAKRTIGVRNA